MPKSKQTPESLQREIRRLEVELRHNERMADEYSRARSERDEGSIPANSYENYAGAEFTAARIEKELEEKRAQLEILLGKAA